MGRQEAESGPHLLLVHNEVIVTFLAGVKAPDKFRMIGVGIVAILAASLDVGM